MTKFSKHRLDFMKFRKGVKILKRENEYLRLKHSANVSRLESTFNNTLKKIKRK